ncbi:MAG: RimK family alpha-L-glutamate ligase [Planctomycetes bacterium]|nr:RimK family alpha-L-glutamate ligase [Planctomycetota bacterium]
MSRLACIVGEPAGWHVRRLAEAVARRGFAAMVVRWPEFSAAVGCGDVPLGPAALAEAHVVAIRGMPGSAAPGTQLEEVIFRMDVLGRLAAAGVPVVNPPRALEIAIDKYLALAVMASAGLPVPRTAVVQGPEAAVEAWRRLGGDCVVKPLFGSRGRGIVRVRSAESLTASVAAGGNIAYLQEFVPHLGWDARVLVVGERLFAMRRRAADGEWRTNLSLGGRAEPLDLPQEWGAAARRAVAAVSASIGGVDLLPATDGRVLVLEVNAVPGWRGLERVAPEVGDAVADHLSHAARP